MTATHLRVTQKLQDGAALLSSDFGIIGDGVTPDDAGVISLSNALADYVEITLHDAPLMLVTQTVHFDLRAGVQLHFTRLPNTTTNRDVGPGFRWGGADGGDVLSLNRTAGAIFSRFKIETEDFFHRWGFAARAIVLDGGQDTGPGAAIGSSCTLRELYHITYPYDLSQLAAHAQLSTAEARARGVALSAVQQARMLAPHLTKATHERKATAGARSTIVEADFITIAQQTKDNQEFHRIERCAGNGNGRGRFLYQGPSYNAKNTKLFDAWYIDAYRRAVMIDNGSLKLRDNNMSMNEWDLWLAFATNYVREEGHIGEGSAHHAFINCAYYGVDNTFDLHGLRPRSMLMPDPIFAPGDVNAHEYPECFILFGTFAADVRLQHGAIEAPPRDANGVALDTRLFGWMGDSSRRIELGPFASGYGHTRRTFGIDEETLSGTAQGPGYMPYAGHVIVHAPPHELNPSAMGILDLPTGELDFGARGVTVERTVDESQLPIERRTVAPTVINVADAAYPFEQLAPGQRVEHETATEVRFRHRAQDGTPRQGVVGAASKTTGK